MKITKFACDCCSDATYQVELDDDSYVTFDGSKFTLHLLRDELQEIYLEAKEQLLHGDD